jgi:hypothetical protein
MSSYSLNSQFALSCVHAFVNQFKIQVTPNQISEYELTVGQAQLFEPEQLY